DGARSPFLKARNEPGPFSASDLAVQAGRELLLRQPFKPGDLSEVIIGSAAASADESNIGRLCALRLGCGHHVPGWTVMRNCASRSHAIDFCIHAIRSGCSVLTLTGWCWTIPRTPLLLSADMVPWLGQWNRSKRISARINARRGVRPQYLTPVLGPLG